MNGILFLAIVLFILFALRFIFNITSKEKGSSQYNYKKKGFLLTRPEHELYDVLVKTFGQEYYIFAQIHLDQLVDHKVVGQNWHAAFRHINEKSVDFVLCDKQYISPKLAIELDEKSHDAPERQERDRIVEGILKEVGLSLLRIRDHGMFNPVEIEQKVRMTLSH